MHSLTSPAAIDRPRDTALHRPSAVREAMAWLAALAITGLAAWLRFYHLGHESLWLDEGVTAVMARMSWREFGTLLWRREGNMVLYYLLVRAWPHAAGSEASLRALPAIFSMATVPVMYLVGRRLFGQITGLLAALLLAINTFHIAYGQEARGYSLAVFFTTLATWFFVRAVEAGERRFWTGWVIAIALGVYCHVFAALVMVAQLITLPLLPQPQWRTRLRPVRWALPGALLPAILYVLFKKAGQLSWVQRVRFADLYELGLDFGGGRVALMIVVLVLAAAGLAVWAYRILRGGRTGQNWTLALACSWFVAPVLLTLLYSLLVRPIWVARFLIVSLPGFLLLIAFVVVRMRLAGVLAAGALVVLAVPSLSAYYGAQPKKDDWRAATRYVLKQASSGDAIVFHQALTRMPFQFYLDQETATAAPHLVSFSEQAYPTPSDFIGMPLKLLLSRIDTRYRRVWLVLNNNRKRDGTPDEYTLQLEGALRLRFAETDSRQFHGISILRLEAR